MCFVLGVNIQSYWASWRRLNIQICAFALAVGISINQSINMIIMEGFNISIIQIYKRNHCIVEC